MFTAQEIANIATEDRDRFEAIGKFSSLIIDDLGCEPSVVKNFGTEVTPVTDILYRRYDAMLTTIVTTNLPAKTIREVYGNRIADRFNEVFDTIGYINPSYR
jgi:DNA replication protein DnaC